jgi:hypothetical protein
MICGPSLQMATPFDLRSAGFSGQNSVFSISRNGSRPAQHLQVNEDETLNQERHKYYEYVTSQRKLEYRQRQTEAKVRQPH